MKAEKKARILASYEYHDAEDVSDERLLQMVADECDCYVDEVLDVLMESEE